METLVAQHNDKGSIISIKNALKKADIPISSIKINTHVIVYKKGRSAFASFMTSLGNHYVEELEQSNELLVPIEEFNEELNDSEIFEIYTDEYFAERAAAIVKSLYPTPYNG